MSHIVVHAHCYQPPREDPWLELVPEEPSALPDHDWNARITRECYRPLSRARVLDAEGRIVRVHNAWAWLSFDVGPTLVHWLERHATDVLDAMREGDRAAITRTGHGTAIAHPYHHIILPLASRRDKRTEIRWGMREFRRVFGRDPFAMWLPETAVDEETLEVLAEEGIRGTILAPRQVTTVGPAGAPVRWDRPDCDMRILAYDGALAHDVAFGSLLQDAERFATRLTEPRDRGVVALATDGETFGHHHRFGDLALARVIETIAVHPTARMVGAEAVLATTDPAIPTGIVAPSAWSCEHGVDRWQADCGCRMDPHTSQDWRAPLRAGLEVLALGLDAVVEREWPRAAGNRHEIRDIAGPRLDGAGPLPPPARRLLEAERHALAMFTSCAWFFDDLARIEPRVVLRHAARALDFLPADDAEALEAALRTALAEAHANDHGDGTGVTIWERDILPGRRAVPAMVAGIAALRELAPHAPFEGGMPAHEWTFDGETIMTTHRASRRTRRWHTEPITLGVVPRRIHVREDREVGWSGVILLEEVPPPLRRRLLALALPVVLEAAVGTRHLDATAMLGGGLAALLPRILRGAWQRGSEDDPVAAATITHAVLDLWSLSGHEIPDSVASEAWLRLVVWPAGPEREHLAERFGLSFRDP
ncbi:MAG TPA: DUF3536 domain-containing protein [Gemmatimonadales bacterium]|nr:DUF3536 domain-containing protein [Gemmatimonadales bacterium]